jgi:hypothetical protein
MKMITLPTNLLNHPLLECALPFIPLLALLWDESRLEATR